MTKSTKKESKEIILKFCRFVTHIKLLLLRLEAKQRRK